MQYDEGKIYLGNGNYRVEVVAGETYGVAIAVNPVAKKAICSINGETFEINLSVSEGRPEYYFRFTDGNYGKLNFTDIKLGYLTDACAHIGEAKTCTEVSGKATDCSKCGSKVSVIHNYVETLDGSGKWIKRECQDCKEYFIVFKDKSIIDKTFATEFLLIDYLTKTYPPKFITILK